MRALRNLIYPKFRIWKRARKLLLEYDGITFNVVSDRRVRMAPPPSDPIADFQNQSGFWYSVADRNGRVLYRRVIAPPLLNGIEVFTNNPAEQLYRLDGAARKVTLVLVIPDLAEGIRLEIFGSRRDADGRLLPAAPLVSVPLRKAEEQGDHHERK